MTKPVSSTYQKDQSISIETDENISSIQSLPLEITYNIFEYLSLKDLLNMSKTSHFFNVISLSKCARQVGINVEDNTSDIQRQLKEIHSLAKRLELPNADIITTENLKNHFSAINEIKCKNFLTVWQKIIDQCPPCSNLTILEKAKSLKDPNELDKMLNEWIEENKDILKDLVELNLSYNQLQALPGSFGNLSNLNRLNLKGNHLQALPASIGKLSNLKWLNLEDNQLQALPGSIGKLSNLEWLDLEDNQLQALPASIGDLSNLNRLYLNGNQLQFLPGSIGNLSNLEVLYLSSNQLQALPDSIGNLSNLEWLDLNGNKLQFLPGSIGNLSNLNRLYLEGNQLQALPGSIGDLGNLEWLDLEGNQLQALPGSFGKLSDCKILPSNLPIATPSNI